MTTTLRMNASSATVLLQRLPSRLTRAIVAAETETIREARKELVEQSSGTLSKADLAQMGHPFARRAVQTPVDSRVINDQGGPFREAWTTETAQVSGNLVVARSRNTTREAGFLKKGTPFMIARGAGVTSAVRERITPARRARLAKASRDAWRKG